MKTRTRVRTRVRTAGLVSYRIAGALLGVTRQRVHQLARDGQLSAIRTIGDDHRVFKVEDVLRLRDQRASAGSKGDHNAVGNQLPAGH